MQTWVNLDSSCTTTTLGVKERRRQRINTEAQQLPQAFPDRPFHNFRASKSPNRRTLWSPEMSLGRFGGFETVGRVDKSVSQLVVHLFDLFLKATKICIPFRWSVRNRDCQLACSSSSTRAIPRCTHVQRGIPTEHFTVSDPQSQWIDVSAQHEIHGSTDCNCEMLGRVLSGTVANLGKHNLGSYEDESFGQEMYTLLGNGNGYHVLVRMYVFLECVCTLSSFLPRSGKPREL